MSPRPITPTSAARASRCMHAWHLECHGDRTEKVEPGEGVQQLIEAGRTWERQCFESLDGAVEVAWDNRDWTAGHAATVGLMHDGPVWIYQPVLVHEDARGSPDLLRRVSGRSSLGPFSYEPVDIKSHKKISAKYRVQIRVSAHLLAPVLGTRPLRGGIWLSSGKMEDIDLDGAEEPLLARMRLVRDEHTPTEGVRCGECGTCPWTAHCEHGWGPRATQPVSTASPERPRES